jgi:hypothetical protein
MLKAHDISSWKIQEKVEVIKNHILQLIASSLKKQAYLSVVCVIQLELFVDFNQASIASSLKKEAYLSIVCVIQLELPKYLYQHI